jgi:hypothetical protein
MPFMELEFDYDYEDERAYRCIYAGSLTILRREIITLQFRSWH